MLILIKNCEDPKTWNWDTQCVKFKATRAHE